MNGNIQEANHVLDRLNEMLEEQTRHLSHTVHAEAGQLLTAVLLRLDQVALDLPPDCGICFHEIRLLIEQIGEQLGDLSHELLPRILDDRGLVPAIECLIERTSRRTGGNIRLDSSMEGRLPALIEASLYRIVQEALTNIAKHARASLIEIRLWQDDRVHCAVRDDGIGFVIGQVLKTKGERGLGLVGIRERAVSLGGELTIRSLPGQGTELLVSVPRGV